MFFVFLFFFFCSAHSSPEHEDIPAELRLLPNYRGPDRMAARSAWEAGRRGREEVSWTRKECVARGEIR